MLKRLFQTIIINLIPSAHRRVNWMRKRNIFKSLGDNVSLQFRKIPLYPECISFHNNIVVASNVAFMTHDAIHLVLNNCVDGEKRISENLGCIEIMDNCFIGTGVTIMPNVRIGPNSIVAAGAVVTKDVPAGEIWGGVVAKRIGTFDELMEKRLDTTTNTEIEYPSRQSMPEEMADFLWDQFYEAHGGGE